MGKVQALVLAAAAAFSVNAQPGGYKVNYTCANNGRYTVSYNDRARHYCWDKVHYSEATAPSHVKEYFANMERELEAAMVDHRRTLAATQSPRAPQTSRSQAAIPAVAPAAQVSLQKLKEIAIGATRAQVQEKLGAPSGRIAGLGEDQLETWTYIVEGGAFARIKLANDAVSAIQLPQ